MVHADVASAPLGPHGLSFLAEPEEVATVRSRVRAQLSAWGLQSLIDSAQLCVSEMVSNVITHVGCGTPAHLAVSRNGPRLRIEVRDPDTRALPTLVAAGDEAEGGRGMALVDALADRWGVELHDDSKVTWCELTTAAVVSEGCVGGSSRVARAERVLGSYGDGELLGTSRRSRLGAMAAEAAAIDVIADLLHWLQAHGHDTDEVLDRAQMNFEAEWNAMQAQR